MLKIIFPADLESSHLIDRSTNYVTYVDGVKVIDNVLLTETI